MVPHLCGTLPKDNARMKVAPSTKVRTRTMYKEVMTSNFHRTKLGARTKYHRTNTGPRVHDTSIPHSHPVRVFLLRLSYSLKLKSASSKPHSRTRQTSPVSPPYPPGVIVLQGLVWVCYRLIFCKRSNGRIPHLFLNKWRRRQDPTATPPFQGRRVFIVWVSYWLTFCKWLTGLIPH